MSTPVNVTELGSSDFKKFLDSFDHVFSDCDDVIWSSNPFPGSGEFFKKMKQHGKTVHYVSNNSLRSRQGYETKFKSIGIEDGWEYLITPSIAIADYLKSVNFTKKVYCIAGIESVKLLKSNGFDCVQGPDIGPDYYRDYMQFLEDDPEIGAVVFDCDFRVNLAKLYKALVYLQRPDVLFLNGATDRYVHFKPGCKSLCTGLFTDLLIKESNREPIQMGKPGKVFGEFAMRRAGAQIPVGIEQDVGLGKNTGFKTLLVLTNVTKEEMLAHETIKPDYYAESLRSILPLL